MTKREWKERRWAIKKAKRLSYDCLRQAAIERMRTRYPYIYGEDVIEAMIRQARGEPLFIPIPAGPLVRGAWSGYQL